MTSQVTSPGARWLPRLARAATTAGTACALVLSGALASPATATHDSRLIRFSQAGPSANASSIVSRTAAADRHNWPGHPGRRLVLYRVQRGDSATGLAVRFHAWTAELRAINHLGPTAQLLVGQRIRIPVVIAAERRAHPRPPHRARPHRKTGPTKQPGHRTKPPRPKPWRQADASREQVRRIIVRTARRHQVDPHLALAIAWQESGWQQRRRSSAGAIGAMQVLPGTGQWMSLYVDRPLNIYSLRDNVTAGVVLVKVLRGHTSHRGTIAAYYQGLGALQKRGVYPSTRTYLRNVLALERLLRRGWDPL